MGPPVIPDPEPFLVDRIADDRAAADALRSFAETLPAVLFPPRPKVPEVVFVAGDDLGSDHPDRYLRVSHASVASYLSRFNQLRVRNDAAAKELVMYEHRRTAGGQCAVCVATVDDRPTALDYPCPTLLGLTWSYVDHPEFVEAWRQAAATWR